MIEEQDAEKSIASVALQNAKSMVVARQRVEDALRDQSEWLRITLASIGDAVISTDAQSRVLFLNTVAECLTGWTSAEAMGRPLPDVFHIINEQSRQTVEDPAHRALREGVVVGPANQTLLIGKDGIERAIEDSAAPIRDDKNEIVGCVLIFRDISDRRKMETESAQAREFAEQIVATVREPLLVLDAHLRVRSANRSFYEFFQIQAVEAENRPFCDLGNGEWDLPALRRVLEDTLSQSASFDDFEVKRTFPNIGERVMLLNARRLHQAGSQTDLLLLAFEDVTAKKRAEESAAQRGRLVALRAELSSALAGRSSIPTCLQRCSEALVKHLDLAFAGVWTTDVATETLELQASAGLYAHQNGPRSQMKVGERSIGRIAQSCKPHVTNSLTSDPEVQHPDWASREGMVAFAGYPLLLEGRALGVLAMFARQPIPEGTHAELPPLADGIAQWLIRQRAEQALREREQRLSALLRQGAVGIAQADMSGKFMFVNQCFADLIGRSPSDVLTLRMQDVTFPDDVATSVDALERVSSSGQSIVVEKRYQRPEGSTVWTLTSLAAVTGDDARTRSVVALIQDITDRKQAEEELKDADRRKNEFLAMLAHELRNPLAPLRTALQLARMSCPEPQKEVGDAYDVIGRQVEHLVRLVDDLLDVSRITSGKIQLQKECVDLAAVISRAVEGARPLIDARRHALVVTLPEDVLRVEVDPVRLAQVLWNLLNNAAKYTSEGGRIQLTATKEEGKAVVRVRDTGMGITPEMLPKVFDLFTQMERTLARAEGGLGIGLTLVRRITEMHDGTVEATSGGPGHGSEFVVRLPLLPHEAPVSQSPVSITADKPGGTSSGKRILVVDDKRDSAETLARLLRRFGNDVQTAHDGLLALEAAAAYDPEVVLLDIGLPGLDGFEVCRRLRRQAKDRQPLIVALTGYGQEDDRRQSEEAGFDAHMVKPVDLEVLKELLSRQDLVRWGSR